MPTHPFITWLALNSFPGSKARTLYFWCVRCDWTGCELLEKEQLIAHVRSKLKPWEFPRFAVFFPELWAQWLDRS